MAKVTWSSRASEDLDDIAAYIEMFDPDAAERTRGRLKALANSLGHFPNRGRPAPHGTREMVTVRPYILRYRVVRADVLILRVRHTARRPLAKGQSLQDNIEADMLAIQRNPGLVRSFFRAPYVAYITD